MSKELRKREIILEYQNLIERPPVPAGGLYQQACQNDNTTINHWRDIWLGNITANKQKYGSFADNSIGELYNKYRYGPAIVAGSGPSLKYNAHELKNRGSIPLISCLHNFHLFEELDLAPEYYVTLDAGPITITEVSEGGIHPEEWYWERTKDRTLLAFIGSPPALLEKWQGKVLFFNAPLPDANLVAEFDKIENFIHYVSSGGNVLGACLYIAKAILGVSVSIFVGADFSFSYENRFHGWDSSYDASMGQCIKCTDIFGIKVNTWPSYFGFKSYFEHVALSVPGYYVNCSEGGCLGAYAEGNLACFKYQDLKDCLAEYNINEQIREQINEPNSLVKKILYS